MVIEVRVPDLGFGPDEPIRLSLWYAEEGTRLCQGDHLAELVVPGAVVDIDAPVDGVLLERLVGLDDTLQVGQVIARMETESWWPYSETQTSGELSDFPRS
ncbi:hypothetical protein HRbin36_00668 [bacterium HR36]|nr:hypothetical protein HRbin36_00668 [bacterium HR36]